MTATISVGAFGVDRRALIESVVGDTLRHLGDGAEQMAAALGEAGVTGYRHDPLSCPIVVVLTDALTEAVGAHLGGSVVAAVDDCDLTVSAPTGEWTFPAPAAVIEFVSRFDAGEWAHLCATKSAATAPERSGPFRVSAAPRAPREAPDLNDSTGDFDDDFDDELDAHDLSVELDAIDADGGNQ